MWLLLGLFVLRVIGQALVAFLDVQFLPPMQAWYSGLVPYELLLPSQILIVALMAKIALDFTRAGGFFFDKNRFFATAGWVLAAFVITVGLSHRKRLRA